MNYPNLFIVSYGRTGSTALMGVLNAIPGYLIRGENGDLVGHLMAIADELRPHASSEPTTPRDAWFGGEHYGDESMASIFRQFIDRVVLGPSPPPDVRCYGFKEIRYGLADVDDKIAFLRRLYPGAGFVFSVRDSARVALSEFQQGVDRDYLDEVRARFVALAAASDSFLMSHEDLVGDSDRILGRLFEFIGEPYDATRIKAVLATRHGYSMAKPGAFLTDFPFYIRVGVGLAEKAIGMLYVNRFTRTPGSVMVGGFVASSRPGFMPGDLKERSGKRILRTAGKDARMQDSEGSATLPVTQFLLEIECPPAVERLTIVLPGGETLFEMNNLRYLGRDLGRRT